MIELQKRYHFREIEFAVLIDDDFPGNAVEERGAYGFLQFIDRVRNSRLRHGQRFRRSGNTALFTDGFEDSKMS